MFDFIFHIPGLAAVKDLNSIYQRITPDLVDVLGWRNSEQCIGKTDHDLPCKASESAEFYIEQDKKVIEKPAPLASLEVQQYADGWKLLMCERRPIKNNNDEVIALFSYGINCSKRHLAKDYWSLYHIDKKFFNNATPVSYILSQSHSPLNLTEKQEICLFYLIRGKSVKEIGQLLKLSPRTVESHIDAMKLKLYCEKKSQLIEKAIMSGFVNYIPALLQVA